MRREFRSMAVVAMMGRTAQADLPTEYIGTNPEEITISYVVAVTFELRD